MMVEQQTIKANEDKNKLSSTSYKYRAIADHLSHLQHRKIRNKYGKAIIKAKREHWQEFL